MKNSLLFLSKNSVPFLEAQVNIHQPTINEISFIGEEVFHIGCQFLVFSINSLSEQDKINLANRTDFEVFMSIMNSKEPVEYRDYAKQVLTLLFPDYEITYSATEILLVSANGLGRINNLNFNNFKDLVTQIFKLNESEGDSKTYDPADGLAAKIAEKFKNRHKKLAEMRGEKAEGRVAILERYVSILTVGEQKDRNSLMELTVAQLKDEFKRYMLKVEFDTHMKCMLAGATNLDKEVEDWMKDFYP